MTNWFKKAGGFVTNELLGVDDFGRVVSKAKAGDFAGALKSAATGALELGSTVAIPLTLGGSAGASLGAKAAVKGGAVAASKIAAKETAKTAAEKATVKAGSAAVKPVPRQWSEGAVKASSQGRGGGVAVQTHPVKAPPRPGTTPGYPLNPGKRPAPGGYPKPGDRRDFDPLPSYRPSAPTPRPNVPAVPKPTPVQPKAAPKKKTALVPAPLPKMGVPEPKVAKAESTVVKPGATPKTAGQPKTSKAAKVAIPAAIAGGIGAATLLPKKTEEKNYKWNPSAIV